MGALDDAPRGGGGAGTVPRCRSKPRPESHGGDEPHAVGEDSRLGAVAHLQLGRGFARRGFRGKFREGLLGGSLDVGSARGHLRDRLHSGWPGYPEWSCRRIAWSVGALRSWHRRVRRHKSKINGQRPQKVGAPGVPQAAFRDTLRGTHGGRCSSRTRRRPGVHDHPPAGAGRAQCRDRPPAGRRLQGPAGPRARGPDDDLTTSRSAETPTCTGMRECRAVREP